MSSDIACARLFAALASAEEQLGRLEGRLAGSSFQQGWLERMALKEAASYAWNQGEIVPLDDLVLHDALMDVHPPSLALTAAHAMLRMRRKALRAEPDRLLVWQGLAETLGPGLGSRHPLEELLAGATMDSPPPIRRKEDTTAFPFLAALDLPQNLSDEDPEHLFGVWAEQLERLRRDWPALLVAALLLDLWWRLDPLPRLPYCGPILIEAVVRREKRVRLARLHLEVGRRAASGEGYRWRADDPALDRVTTCLTIIACGAGAGAGELDQMLIAQQLFARRLKGRRSSSRLPRLADLLLTSPIVTAPMAAERLKLSQQAVRSMITELGGAVHEVTGRGRFRAWRI